MGIMMECIGGEFPPLSLRWLNKILLTFLYSKPIRFIRLTRYFLFIVNFDLTLASLWKSFLRLKRKKDI